MSFKDIRNYFTEVGIVRADDRNSYTYVRLPPTPPRTLTGVEVEFKRKTKGAFEIHQPTRRNYPGKTKATYKYGGLHFKIIHLGTGTLLAETIPLVVAARSKWHKFEPGRYLIVCTTSFRKKKKVILSFYGSSSPTMVLSKTNTTQIGNALLRCFTKDTIATGTTKLDFAKVPGLRGVRKTYESGMCMVYNNDSSDVTLEEDLEVDMNNTWLVGGVAGAAKAGRVKLKLPPGSQMSVLLQVVSPGSLWGATYTRHLNIITQPGGVAAM